MSFASRRNDDIGSAPPRYDRRGDVVVSIDAHNVFTATAIQKLVEDATARRIERTVWRNGALVDVFVVPRELAER